MHNTRYVDLDTPGSASELYSAITDCESRPRHI